MKQHLKTSAGFTLAEILVGMALLVIVVTVLSQSMPALFKSQSYNYELAANINDERFIINRITKELKGAISVSSPTAGKTASAISYRCAGDSSDRQISFISTGANAHSVYFTNPNPGGTNLYLGQGWVKSLTFTANPSTQNLFKVALTIQNSQNSNAPVNETTFSVYTLRKE